MITPEHFAVKACPYFEIGHLSEGEIACSAPARQTDIVIGAKFVHSIVDLVAFRRPKESQMEESDL
jgi:hypothetical protein